MNSWADDLIGHLERSADVIRAIVRMTSPEQQTWKPDSNSDPWSVLEVIGHLLDEEREDFRVRLGLVLENPEIGWPAIDPQGWVNERSYATRDLDESLALFLTERRESVQWLRGLRNPEWASAKNHPLGALSAGDLLASWTAHDLLHIRQLVRLHLQYVQQRARPYSTDYAGEW